MRRRLSVHLMLLLAGCGGGAGDPGPSQAQDGLFGRVTANGLGVAGAQVAVGGAVAQTDADGRYAIASGAGAVVVRVDAVDHIVNVQRITISGATALDVALLPEAPAHPLDASVGGMVEGERGARVVVPANGLVDPDGRPVSGEVAVHLTPIDPGVPAQLDAAPGDFEARASDGARAQLESFGMLDVTIRQGDATLQVAPGETLQIRIPAPMGQTALPPSMPLWSFDEAQGLWIEEGSLTLDAESGTYAGEIAHMSVWNADEVIDTTCISGAVIDADTGEPLAGARISGRGVDYFGTDGTVTDGDGRFALLVRKNSDVSVAAYHAEGGGEIRTVRSGDVTAPQPVSPGDASCTDGGTWAVRRGEVVFDGGAAVQCQADVFEQLDLTRCVPLLADLVQCHQPAGACTQSGLLDIEYANGAANRTVIGDDGSVSIEYFGPGGVPCGRQRVDTTQAANGRSRVTLELPDGRAASYGVSIDTSSGSLTYTCADGSTRQLTSADQQRIQACTGGDTDACEPADGPMPGGTCESAGDCAGGLVCCQGICLQRDNCPFIGCDADAQCEGGEICCPVTQSCLTEAQCVDTGWCDADGQCGEGRACCDGGCVERAFCEGQCRGDADCGDGICCAQADGLSWCAEDAEQCFGGQACEGIADCGDPSTLTCCDGACQTWQDCYAGESCGDQSACGGEASPLECCDQEGTLVCLSAVDCASFRPCDEMNPCGAGTECCNNPEVREAFICLPPALCVFGMACDGADDCPSSLCCALPEQEPVCIQECPEEWQVP